MAKNKTPKGAKGMLNKHLHSRISYLYQAATYLSFQSTTGGLQKASSELAPSISTKAVSSGLALQLGSHLRAVSLKGQVQLSQNVKRSICKCCNTILIPGRTSTTTVENNSRGGKKPWADVLLVECTTCGSKKRFPMGSKWQVRKTERSSA
ncbi:Rpr2-domain-containing protein, partial [Lepidopterella palustris CBS 459.81]